MSAWHQDRNLNLEGISDPGGNPVMDNVAGSTGADHVGNHPMECRAGVAHSHVVRRKVAMHPAPSRHRMRNKSEQKPSHES